MLYLLTSVSAAIGTDILGYLFHRILHALESFRRGTSAHAKHHFDLYPPDDFLSDHYRSVGDVLTFALAGILPTSLLFAVLSPRYAACATASGIAVGLLNAYVHDALHIRAHWLERLPLFQRWRQLHLQHHRDPKTNFGIFTFACDRLARTYRTPPAYAMSTLITPHFSIEEFHCHDGTPYPTEWIECRLHPLCTVLETVRAELGSRPTWILSGYRTLAHNRAVGGAPHSQHTQGRAADITVENIPPSVVHAAVLRLFHAGRIEIGGLGLYASWIHVDIRPRPPSGYLATWTGSSSTPPVSVPLVEIDQ
jgi:hypothetical protein